MAPGSNEESFVNHLFEQGQIPKRVVGLNFEDPTDRSQVSTITFGYIDYNQIRGGEDGFNYYSNIGLNHWAVMLDDMQYNRMGLSNGNSAKMAVIDSGNTSI